MMNLEPLAQALRGRLELTGMGPGELAAELGIPGPTISHILHPKPDYPPPSMRQLMLLLGWLRVDTLSVAALLGPVER